ncbi:ABC transporter permease [Citricoccus sp. NPDC079358]|uniref:ABC transporter permease n=1 Tax=Citricoccus sp. NPDC079358 TaxID=3154653 RepID=UPI00344CC30D
MTAGVREHPAAPGSTVSPEDEADASGTAASPRAWRPRVGHGMRRYVAGRAGHALLVVALVYLLTYWVLFALPGDPVRNRLENPQNPVPPEQAQVIIEYYNLDLSAVEQFLITLGRLFQGDLGYSLGTGRAVGDLFAQGIGSTLLLALVAFGIAVLIATLVAVFAVFSRSAAVRAALNVYPSLALSTPSFLVGLFLLQLFSYQLGWVSALDTDGPAGLILPALTLGIAVSPSVTQVLIQGLGEANDQPFVKVLKAKGLSRSRIIGRHLLRNGSIPALTLLALTIADLIAGSVIVESVFNRAGLGLVTEQAVRSQDSPVVLAVVLFVAALYSVVNLIADLIYPLIDPRIVITESRVARRPARRPAGPPGDPNVSLPKGTS